MEELYTRKGVGFAPVLDFKGGTKRTPKGAHVTLNQPFWQTSQLSFRLPLTHTGRPVQIQYPKPGCQSELLPGSSPD